MQTTPSTADTPTPTAQALVWLSRRYPHRRLALATALISLAIGNIGELWFLRMLGAGLLAYCGLWLVRSLRLIDANIRATVGVARTWKVHAKIFPAYKYVDLYHAAQRWSGAHQHSVEICSQHAMPLAAILRGTMPIGARAINAAAAEPRKIGFEQVTYLPVDTFWLIPPMAGRPLSAAIIRISHYQRGGPVQIEVATPRPHDAERILEEIGEIALAQSIYRGRMIRVAFGPEVSTDYGDDESLEEMDLLFYDEKRIDEHAIILDDGHRGIIDRTIIDFHQRRERLRQLGLSGKRGVLFYGPPGTGKTYTCKYIAQQLDGATTIVVTGAALLRMKAVCAIAKVFQPAFVLLEDVDLVFSHRESNAYNTVLGEFIDQLDGFGETDQILFVLTTNAIERIEPAIKDRPGRVSQCIYFGPPSALLRRRYLELLVEPYDATLVNLQQIVGQTDGVSQAFLKELVARTTQIASRASGDAEARIRLTDADFQSALHDMTQGVGYVGQRIIGFRMESDH